MQSRGMAEDGAEAKRQRRRPRLRGRGTAEDVAEADEAEAEQRSMQGPMMQRGGSAEAKQRPGRGRAAAGSEAAEAVG